MDVLFSSEGCCRRQETSNFEAVQHSIECGAGTAVMLAVYSTSIIVIRGKRACLWGSVYLDSFGEEDRDLKRGKTSHFLGNTNMDGYLPVLLYVVFVCTCDCDWLSQEVNANDHMKLLHPAI